MITTAVQHGRSLGSAVLVGLLLVVVAPLTPARAEDTLIHVPVGAGTIQAAIDLAPAGGIVLVAPGTYRENLRFKGKAVEVRSVTGPATTIIDGGGAGPVAAFYGRETRTSVLRGFTIRNGRNGIDSPNASPTIVGNIITGNSAWDGGGIRIDTSEALIQGNVIRGNSATMGGGLYVAHATGAEIVGNTIEANISSSQGGGIQFAWSGEPMVRDNLIRGNRASTGGGFSTVNAPTRPMVVNNVFVGNEANEGGAVAFQPVLGTFGAPWPTTPWWRIRRPEDRPSWAGATSSSSTT